MDILVFGKTGQVATELMRRGKVRSLGRDQADLLQPEACAQVIRSAKPDVVVNAAAYTAVDRAEEELASAQTVNAEAPGAMARAAAEIGARFLHVSTDYVFDGSGETPWRPTDAPNPLGAYGRTKLDGERQVIAAGGAFAILRTSWVFSAHGANFVKTMLRLGAERDQLSVVCDQIGGPTSAGSIAQALLQIAQMDGPSGIYHFAGKPSVSWADFAREIFSKSGISCQVNDIPSAQYPTPAKRPQNSRLDCAGLKDDYGIGQPDWRLDLDEILRELA